MFVDFVEPFNRKVDYFLMARLTKIFLENQVVCYIALISEAKK
jgi:hypothetical protein